jgi:hypothetical protein
LQILLPIKIEKIHTDIPTLYDIPVNTVLSLPLYKLLRRLPPSHWTIKHQKYFDAHHFLIFDERIQRLRLKVDGEFTKFRKLCKRLVDDILVWRTIKLVDFIWPHICQVPNTEAIDWLCHPLRQNQVKRSPLWSSFTRKKFYQHYQETLPTTAPYRLPLIKSFWSCNMYPQARTVFYRALSQCIPTKPFLCRFNMVPSPNMVLLSQRRRYTQSFPG